MIDGVGSACKHGGYTIIETVVALAIAGLALTGLLQAVAGNAQRSALSREYVVAAAFGESMLARVGRDIVLDAGIETGWFDDVFHWRRTMRPLATGARNTVIPYEVILSVRWRSAGRARDLSLRTLRLKIRQRHAST